MKRPREPEELPPTLSPPALSDADDVDAVDTDSTDSRSPMSDSTCYVESATEQPRAKIASVSHDPDAADGKVEPAVMTCLLHSEHIGFPSYEEYESHYNKEHLNRCIECRRNFPSPMYLSLHGDEWHDPFVAVRREKGEHTYACFVEGCERKCGSMDKRRRHLIDKHGFPNNFFFLITQFGIDGRHSLLDDGGRRWYHRRRPSASNPARKDVRRRAASVTVAGANGAGEDAAKSSDGDGPHGEGLPGPGPTRRTTDPVRKEKPDVQMDDLAGAMSAMTFIPRSVRFGRGGSKAGFVRR